jgi:hypothetical protein
VHGRASGAASRKGGSVRKNPQLCRILFSGRFSASHSDLSLSYRILSSRKEYERGRIQARGHTLFPLAYVVDGVGVGVCDGGSVGGGGGGSVGGSVGGGVLGQSSGKKFWPVDRNPRCARLLLPLKRVVRVVRGVCKASVAERGGTADHAAVPPAAHRNPNLQD